MRYIAFVFAMLALPVLALDVVVNGENVGQTDKLVIDDGRVVINTNSQPEPEPESTPEPEPEPTPEPDPPSQGCSDRGVVCKAHIGNLDSASLSGLRYTIPQGKVVASRFTPTASGPIYGKFNFLRSFSDYNIWVSEKPGGPKIKGGPWDYNAKRCEFSPAKYSQSLRWTREEGGDWKRCSLETGKTYYVNVEFSDKNQKAGRIDRTFQK